MSGVALLAGPQGANAGTNRDAAAPMSSALHSTIDPARGLDVSLRKEGLHALDLGIRWLESQQSDDGSWSQPTFPALTALAVMAMCRDPRRDLQGPLPASAQRGIAFLLDHVQPDGGIYVPADAGGGMPLYNTALSMTALIMAGRRSYETVVTNAEGFLASSQHLGHDMYSGGFGYEAGGDREYADLSSTYMALEAMWAAEVTAPTDTPDAPSATTLNWGAALDFVSRVQNRPESNDRPWARNPTEDDRGGFVYRPDQSKAGEEVGTDGSPQLHSYGSMSYAGLLSFIYAGVGSDDERVTGAVDWVRRHYTVDENPGMGAQGLFYNYHTMAKALTHWGEEPLHLPGGGHAWWRGDLVGKLVSLQRIAPETSLGYWVNDQGRWWENDPVLATCYSLVTMDILLAPSTE